MAGQKCKFRDENAVVRTRTNVPPMPRGRAVTVICVRSMSESSRSRYGTVRVLSSGDMAVASTLRSDGEQAPSEVDFFQIERTCVYRVALVALIQDPSGSIIEPAFEFVELRSEEGKSHALACLARALARKSRPTDLGSRIEHAPRLGAHSARLVEAVMDVRAPTACDVSVARSVPTPDRGRAFAAPILVPWSGRSVDFFETRLHVPRSVRLVEDMADVRTESGDLRKPCIS